MGIKASFDNVKISGIATVAGSVLKSIDDEVEAYGGDAEQIERIKKSVGIHTRYVADEQTTACDLCLQAAKKLLHKMDIPAESIDGVVFVTVTPDYRMPGNAHLIHKELGIGKDCAVFDVCMGCSGYVYGLWMAFMMASSSCKRILLCAGDTISKLIHPRDRASAPVFGDAGSATLIERTENRDYPSHFVLYSDGQGFAEMIQPAGGFRHPFSKETKIETTDNDGNVRTPEHFYMNGFNVFNFTMTKQPSLLGEIMAEAGKTPDTVDYFVLHQANSYIIKTITRRAKIDIAKAPYKTFETFGNSVSASVPSAVCHELNEQACAKKLDVVFQGYGLGLSWGACSLALDHICCLALEPYKKEGELK